MMLVKAFYQSPLGCIEVTGSELGIRKISMKPKEGCPDANVPELLQPAIAQLDEYFNGNRKQFELRLDFSDGTDFYKQVWAELLKIPYGHTTSYSAVAEKIGHPDAVRAVGLANRNNPLAIVVPCHRVIGKSGDLQGYFYGLDIKRKLLQLENPMSFGEQGELF
jgi:methylated-DNA-[protein]-cysteine S-methyltransferase